MGGRFLSRVCLACLLAGYAVMGAAQPASGTAAGADAANAQDAAAAATACLPPLDAASDARTPAAARAGAAKDARAESFVSYVDEPVGVWRRRVRALRGLKLDKTPAAENPCVSILERTGSAVLHAVQKLPNLAAKERLSQIQVKLPYYRNQLMPGTPSTGRGRSAMQPYGEPESLEGEELDRDIHDQLVLQTVRTEYGYRIRKVVDEKAGVMLYEYRTDNKDQPVEMSSSGSSPRDVGFGNSWMLLAPANVQQSRFRYLGRQRIGRQETFVLAFSQVPEKVTGPAEIVLADAKRSFYVQGVIWIDQRNYQILRLQTDLRGPVAGTTLKRLRSEIEFSEVKIPQLTLPMWMPRMVEVNWEMQDDAGGELHFYSDYRLFQVSSRILSAPGVQ